MSSRGHTCPLCDSHSFHSQLILSSLKIKLFRVIRILLSQKHMGFIFWHISKVRVENIHGAARRAAWGSSLLLSETLVGILYIYVYICLNRVRAPKAAALCQWKWKQSQLASVTRGAQSKHRINMLLKEAISQGDFNILQIQILWGAVLTQVWRQRCIYFNCIALKRDEVLFLCF